MLYKTCYILLICLICPQLWARPEYTRKDLLGAGSLCENIRQSIETGNSCSPFDPENVQAVTTSANALDRHLALAEIKRNILFMAEAQTHSSLLLLQKLGMKSPGMELDRKLLSLKDVGFDPKLKEIKAEPELSQKYLLAALRYHELKSLMAQGIYQGEEKKTAEAKLKFLELRYPLISHHHFEHLRRSVTSHLKIKGTPQRELNSTENFLDQFLLEDVPANLSSKNLSGHQFKSLTGQVALLTLGGPDLLLKESLVKELETSFSNQLAPLVNLSSLKDCDLFNLHSGVSLQVINTSANPEQLFGDYCACQTEVAAIDEDIVTGLEVASMAGLGLCLTPTGAGQVFGCPTALVAGLGATGANAINFIDKAQDFQTVASQKNIVEFLDRTNLDKEEEAFLADKELVFLKEAGVSGLVSLIGFGVGNLGIKKLAQYYENGKLSAAMKNLTSLQNRRLDKAMEELTLEEQTKAFVLLEKLDQESRDALITHPELIVKELKQGGKSCDM